MSLPALALFSAKQKKRFAVLFCRRPPLRIWVEESSALLLLLSLSRGRGASFFFRISDDIIIIIIIT